MFQERYNRIVLPFFYIFELIIVLITIYIAFLFDNKHLELELLIIPVIFWAIPSVYFKSYSVPRVHSYIAALRPTFFTYSIFFILYIIFIRNGLYQHWSIIFHGIFLISIALVQHLLSLSRYYFFLNYRRQGKNIRYVILLGNISFEKVDLIKNDGIHFGYKFLDNFSKSEEYLVNLNKAIKEKVDIIFLKETDKKITDTIRAFCDEHGIRLRLLLSFSPSTSRRIGLDTIGGFPIMDVRNEPLLFLGNRIIKRIIDIVMSSLSIFFVLSWLPIMVKISQIITYPGPLFFIQDRIGRDGKVFRLYKFRTMYISDETEDAQKGKAKKTKQDDNRVPAFGRFLRRTNLDEYPQFLNVLIGSMSTIGPRPHMVGEDVALEKNVRRYRIRRFIKPGITGWAAINGLRGGTEDIELMIKRTEYDIWYIENWSMWLDIKIIFITIWQMITFRIPKAY